MPHYLDIEDAWAHIHPDDLDQVRTQGRGARVAGDLARHECICRIAAGPDKWTRMVACFVPAGPTSLVGARYVVMIAQRLASDAQSLPDMDALLGPLWEALSEMRHAADQRPPATTVTRPAKRQPRHRRPQKPA